MDLVSLLDEDDVLRMKMLSQGYHSRLEGAGSVKGTTVFFCLYQNSE